MGESGRRHKVQGRSQNFSPPRTGPVLPCIRARPRSAVDTLREYDSDEPRDERGRWTTGGSFWGARGPAPTAEWTKRVSIGMVDKLKNSKEGKSLFDKAEKAAKGMGHVGPQPSESEPAENLPAGAERAQSNPGDGGIGIRDDLSDAKALETVVVELENMAQAEETSPTCRRTRRRRWGGTSTSRRPRKLNSRACRMRREFGRIRRFKASAKTHRKNAHRTEIPTRSLKWTSTTISRDSAPHTKSFMEAQWDPS